MNQTATLTWFARHELKLAWRDWIAMMSGGRKLRDRTIWLGLGLFAFGLHVLVYAVMAPSFPDGVVMDTQMLVSVTGSLVLALSMMLSQSMESVTRAFYARDDLDLILSSPASSNRLFAVRIGAIAASTAAMSAMLAAPLINAMIAIDGVRWLGAYGVLAALAALATGLSVLITIGLFRWVGAKRTRLIAQIVAAVVGATFLIGIQVVAIVHYGKMSRFEVFGSQWLLNAAPSADSWFWVPVDAAVGNPLALFVVSLAALAFLAVVIAGTAHKFGEYVLAAAGVSQSNVLQKPRNEIFRKVSTAQALRQKEWKLLQRDPWLASQTLMQILYLIPPALMLWQSFGKHTDVHVIIAPVIVMALGQLAGGLAWLAVSGEDAPDLMHTAPLTPRAITRAKVEAVLMAVGLVGAPMLLGVMLVSQSGAAIIALGALAATLSAILIQLWFRTQSKRSNFRRRQVSSRAATFCEAFSSISWAGTTCLAAAGSWGAVAMGVISVLVLAIAYWIRPREA